MREKMTKELHLKMVEAHWDGKLEVHNGAKWTETTNGPTAISDPAKFRIRPTPKLRPWKAEEVPVGALIRFKGRESEKHSWVIVGYSEQTGQIAYGQKGEARIDELHGYEHSINNGSTWLPCGVEEVEQ